MISLQGSLLDSDTDFFDLLLAFRVLLNNYIFERLTNQINVCNRPALLLDMYFLGSERIRRGTKESKSTNMGAGVCGAGGRILASRN